MRTTLPEIPVLRAGVEYESLETVEVRDVRSGEVVARVHQANAGIVRRDLGRMLARPNPLASIPAARLLEISGRAAELFLAGDLPLREGESAQSPQDYVASLARTSGLPWTLVRRNMEKIATVLREMPRILAGLTRGLDPSLLDHGIGHENGRLVSFAPRTASLGVVLPSNSPGVNSLWLPALALKIPVVLKPGRDEPWTPLRLARALVAAGMPPGSISLYPTDHEGAGAILELCGRTLLFGDEATTARWAGDPRVEIHGPGRSKILIGADMAARFAEHRDCLVASVLEGGGRSCINVSTIYTAGKGREVAETLARALVDARPRAADDSAAVLSAFANPRMAEGIDAAIERGLAEGGARDVSRELRGGEPRLLRHDGATWLLPTIVHCDSPAHPLARTEYLFPYTAVVELDEDEMLASMGPTLVATVLTRDPRFVERVIGASTIGRLNIGPIPTTRVEWDQPHEGNLFEHLWVRRAIQQSPGW
jgi:acyl-CoA reductase-like NAD-dependent aldehyde dehydrogenase